jgi:hypothetical protein
MREVAAESAPSPRPRRDPQSLGRSREVRSPAEQAYLRQRRDLELEAISLTLAARRLSLALGALLILTGALMITWITISLPAAIGPVGLIGAGVGLIRFGGRSSDLQVMTTV